MAYGTVNADVIQSSVSGVSLGAGNATGFKNRIINGDMRIDQRNAGASGSLSGYPVDRWYYYEAAISKGTWQQNQGSVTPPTGFVNYLGFTSSSAYTVGASENFVIEQKIEGLNFSDFAFGTANAKTVTLSFWVRSSLTGTFSVNLNNSAQNRCYPATYTISSANTWEQKSITIAGDTTGTWLTTNGIGCRVTFNLGSGSSLSSTANTWYAGASTAATGATSVVGTNGATFYITGVQLEVGSSATGFEYRDYGSQLAMCQRYYFKLNGANQYLRAATGYAGSSTILSAFCPFAVAMRIAPTSIDYTNYFAAWNGGTLYSVSGGIVIDSSSTSPYTGTVVATTSGLSTNSSYQLIGNNNSAAALAFNAEL